MTIKNKLISVFLAFWAGLIGGISFLEAWLKFRAEGVTREIGLSIGKLVFTALNRVELVLLISIWILFLLQNGVRVIKLSMLNALLAIVSLILLTQTFYFLPELVYRAELIINSEVPSDSYIHLWFILFEFIKLILLVLLSIKVLSKSETITSKL